jgi:LacI family transcriptional regulator
LQDELAASGNTLLVATSHYDPQIEAAQIRTLLGRGVDGLALIGEARPTETYRLLQERKIPFVLLWSHRPDCPHSCVGFDNHEAARQMAEAVLDRGHRRIAMIAGVTAWNDRATSRIAGVRDALAAKALSLEPPYLVETRYTIDASVEAARRLLALPDPPTAIICGNDVQAAGALRAVHEAGLAAPDDVSIVGFDDIELAVALNPLLTTVRVPHRRMGEAAARLLLRLVSGLDSGESIAFETRVVERASLGLPRS